jgi:hypothetical protein
MGSQPNSDKVSMMKQLEVWGKQAMQEEGQLIKETSVNTYSEVPANPFVFAGQTTCYECSS